MPIAITIAIAEALRAVGGLLVPVACAGCGGSGDDAADAVDRSLCDTCRAALIPQVTVVARDTRVGTIRVCAAVEYRDVARSVLVRYKDAGRTDLAGPLAAALRSSIVAALSGVDAPGRPIELCVPPPSREAFRRRGYRPVDRLLAEIGLRPAAILRPTRDRCDQSELDRVERADNLAGAFAANRDLPGRAFLAVDDVLTTGATLAEMARAIVASGGAVVGFAVVAHTLRHHP